jgi:hypothetical protein
VTVLVLHHRTFPAEKLLSQHRTVHGVFVFLFMLSQSAGARTRVEVVGTAVVAHHFHQDLAMRSGNRPSLRLHYSAVNRQGHTSVIAGRDIRERQPRFAACAVRRCGGS